MKKLIIAILALTAAACNPDLEKRIYDIPVVYFNGDRDTIRVWSIGPHYVRLDQGDLKLSACQPCDGPAIASSVRSIGEVAISKDIHSLNHYTHVN